MIAISLHDTADGGGFVFCLAGAGNDHLLIAGTGVRHDGFNDTFL